MGTPVIVLVLFFLEAVVLVFMVFAFREPRQPKIEKLKFVPSETRWKFPDDKTFYYDDVTHRNYRENMAGDSLDDAENFSLL